MPNPRMARRWAELAEEERARQGLVTTAVSTGADAPEGRQNPAGAPAALLPPYTDLPRGFSGREAASSRVSAGRDPGPAVYPPAGHGQTRTATSLERALAVFYDDYARHRETADRAMRHEAWTRARRGGH